MIRKEHLPDIAGATAGIAFAVSLFLSIASIDPLRGATDQELFEWWSDGGLRRDSIISMYLMFFAAPCFLVFVSVLRTRLRAPDGESAWTGLVHGAGIAFATLLAVSAIVRGVVAQAVRFGDEPVPGPDTLRYATELQYVTYGLAAIPFVLIVITAPSIQILRMGILSRWIGWLGLSVTAVGLALTAAMVGPFATPLILLWVLAASAHLFRTRGASAQAMTAGRDVARTEPQRAMTLP